MSTQITNRLSVNIRSIILKSLQITNNIVIVVILWIKIHDKCLLFEKYFMIPS